MYDAAWQMPEYREGHKREGRDVWRGRDYTSGQLFAHSRHPGNHRTGELGCSRLLDLDNNNAL